MDEDTSRPEDLDDLSVEDEQPSYSAADSRSEQNALKDLAEEIERKYTNRKAKFQIKHQQMLLCDELYLGSVAGKTVPRYTSDRPFSPQSINSQPPELNIVGRPVDAVVSIMWSKQFAGGDKNWQIGPAANSQNPQLTMMAATAMEATIEDQLRRCKYPAQPRLAMDDRAKRGTGILKGPINVGRTKKHYVASYTSDGQKLYLPKMAVASDPYICRVDPFFYFPDETVIDPARNPDSIEYHPWTRSDLEKAKLDDKHFKPEVIFEILREEAPGSDVRAGLNPDFADLNDNTEAFRDHYQVLEYHGPIYSKDLGELGLEPTYDSPDGVYYAEVWVCRTRVIRLDLHPIEGCFAPPYTLCPYIKDPGSQFGIGLPLILADQQHVINRLWQMTMDNASISSGPQVVINKQNVKPSDGAWELAPDKIWYNTEYGMNADANRAVQFFVPPNTTAMLMEVLNAAKNFALEESGIPVMQAGLQSPQTTQSATMTMALMEQSTTPIDFLNEMWDDYVTEPQIRGMVDWNMQNNPDESIKGDGAFEVDVKTTSDYKATAMHVGDLEKLSLETAQNPNVGMLVNQDELYRARLAMMKIPHKLIVKSPEEAQKAREEAAKQPSPEQVKLQIEQTKLQLEQLKLQTEQVKAQAQMMTAQVEAQQTMQLAQWDHEEKMAAQVARLHEAQAQVITSATQERIEYLKLAQKDGVDQAKIMTEMNKIQLQDERERFDIGVNAALKAQELKNFQDELELAKTSKDNDGI